MVAIMYSHSFLICSAIKQMMSMVEDFRYHVRCHSLDEFSNIGSDSSKFDKLIATIRSREISASIILQSQSQLKAMYKDVAGNHSRGIVIPYYFLEEKKAPR
ncbi:MAG: TraM recognition domain-containing protein [Mediterraneibacter gnavus]